ncbi:MAG TPA: HAD-IC family P-type ATPase, partial [Anaerolineales bacterium]
MTDWHNHSIDQTIKELGSDPETGLSPAEAASRMGEYGPNELVERGGRGELRILWDQLRATMVLILIAAAIAAAALGDLKDGIAISAIIVLYVILGFIQEYRAEQAIAALKKMAVPKARVLRGNNWQDVSARELVPGDVLQLEAGNVLPADVRLLEAVNLRVQEAALTGESEPVEKMTDAIPGEELPLGDRRNMGYMGTIVTQGRGQALVTATGMQTELGRIAELIQQQGEEHTPLQKRLDALGRNLALAGAGIAVLVVILGMLRGDVLRHLLLTAVSVAVAIIPEGLPAVVTITLALGAQRMLKQNALIRRLPAVETLGSVTVICSDKTGTLTENRMTVVVLDVADHSMDLTEDVGRGGSVAAVRNEGPSAESALSLTLIGGALCNDARLIDIGDNRFHTLGDPTEGALVSAAAKMGYWKSSLDSSFPRAAELPFDSERKRMTTVHDLSRYDRGVLSGLEIGGRRYIAFSKGSVDGLVGHSSRVWVNGRAQPLDEEYRSRIESANERLAQKGMRVLGVAFRLLDEIPRDMQHGLEQDLTFIGLFGMIDPPRAEVRDAVAVTRSAGIRTLMITGDHPLTASEIARQLGIMDIQATGPALKRVLTGAELEKMSAQELKRQVEQVQVFARVSPAHKLRIVEALQAQGHIVSMTGDGVNDAPALRRADIGVAMGIMGTDVS